MSAVSQVALYIAAAFAVVTMAIILAFCARAAMRWFADKRMRRRVSEVEAILKSHQSAGGVGVERLLFQLGSIDDSSAVEVALREVLENEDERKRYDLRRIFDSLGLTTRYVADIRSARKWTDRARACWAVGELGVVEAVPELIACMRDPDEDTQTVKRAAAQALSAIRAEEALPLLVAELDVHDQWASPRIADVVASFGEKAVPLLLAALTDGSGSNARMWVAQILGNIGEETAVNALLRHLRDRSEHVRVSVCEALGRLKAKTAVNDLIHLALRDPVAPVRAEAARALGEIGDDKATESLTLLLSDPDYWARLRAIEALEVIRPRDTTFLETALRDPSPEVRRRAAVALDRIGVLHGRIRDLVAEDSARASLARETLVEIGKTGFTESLAAYLEDADFRIRCKMAEILGDVGDPGMESSLEPLLQDPMWPVRARAVEAVGRLGSENGLQILMRGLGDAEETVRDAAATAIRGLKPSENIDQLKPLIDAFDTDNAAVRCTVVEAVGLVENDVVVALLQRGQVDPNPKVRRASVNAISERGGSDLMEQLVVHLRDSDIGVRIAAARGLRKVGSPAALKEVVACLDTHDRQFREALTEILAQFGVSAIAGIVSDQQNLQRTLALVWALGKTGEPAALPLLERLSRHQEQEVRSATAGALGKINNPGIHAVLAALLRDRDERTRAAAVNALGGVGRKETVSHLESALADPDTFVRNRAAIALGKLPDGVGERALVARLAEVSDSQEERAYTLVGLSLVGSKEATECVLSALTDKPLQEHLQKVVAREDESVRDLYHRNLAMQGAGERGFSSTAEMATHYASELRSEQEPRRRITAIRAIRLLGGLEFVDLLIDTVHTDPVEHVRAEALAALASHVSDRDVRICMEKSLRDPNVEVQIAAVRALEPLADTELNRALLKCYLRGSTELSRAATTCLAQANRDDPEGFIDLFMGAPEDEILCGGTDVLGEIGGVKPRRLLEVWLRDNRSALRCAAVRALVGAGDTGSRAAVRQCLNDTDHQVRETAVVALAKLGVFNAPEYERLAMDPSVRVRVALATCISEGPLAWAFKMVDALIKDAESKVRVAVLASLARRAEVDAIERLNWLLKTQTDEVKAALRDISGDNDVIRELRTRATSGQRSQSRICAVRALRTVGSHPLELWVSLLTDPDPDVRLEVVQSVSGFRDPRLGIALQLLTSDPDPRVRDAVRRKRVQASPL